MADAVLSVELTAKIDTFIAEMSKAKKVVEETAIDVDRSVKKVDQSFSLMNNAKFTFGSNFSKASKSVKQFSEDTSKYIYASTRDLATLNSVKTSFLTTELNKGTTSLRIFGTSLRENISGIKRDNIDLTSKSLSNFSKVIDNTNTNVPQLVKSLSDLSNSNSETSSSISDLAGGLSGPLALAFTVVSAGVGLYIEYLKNAEQSFNGVKYSAEIFSKALESTDYKNSIQNVNELTINLDLAKKGFISKTGVINEYNDTLGKTAGKVTTLDEVETNLVSKGKAYIRMMLLKASAQLALKDAADEAYKAEQIRENGRLTISSPNLQDKTGFANVSFLDKLKSAFSQDDNETKKLIIASTNRLAKAADEKTKGILNIANNFQKSAAEIAKKFKLNFFGDTKDDKETKEPKDLKDKSVKGSADKVAEIYKKLSDDLKSNPLEFGSTKFEIAIKDIQSYQKAIEGLSDNGFDKASKAITSLIGKQNDLSKFITGTKLKPVNLNIGALLGLGGSKEFTIRPRLKIEPIVVGISELQKITDDLNNKFLSLVESSLTGGLGSIGKAIGDSIANGGNAMESAGSALLSTFSGFLSKFGELLIEYGTAAVLKGKLDIAAFIPGAGIAAGIAAIAAGIVLVAASSAINGLGGNKGASGGGKVTAFANGGIISGPTLGLMGEYAGAKSDPEVVAPLSKLQNILGKTDSAGNATSNTDNNIYFDQRIEIDGDKLVVLTDRIRAKRSRIK